MQKMKEIKNVEKGGYRSKYLERERYHSGEKALTRAEYEKLLSACDTFEDELFIRFAIATGLRREDFVNVKIGDIDTKNKLLSFYERKKKRNRTIPLSNDLCQLIEKYKKIIPKGQEKLFPFSSRTAYNRLQELCKKAGIAPRPFHALRATCMKFCQHAGWTLEQTAALVGDTIEVVQEHYLTPSFDEMREVVEEKKIS
jgi:integrase